MKTIILLLILLPIMACYEPSNTVTVPSESVEKLTHYDHWYLFGEHGINISPAWQITHGRSDVTVAVLDNVFVPENPIFSQGLGDCRSKFKYVDIANKPLQEGTHGAAVASAIHTCEDNPYGLLGTNKNSFNLWVNLGGPFFLLDTFKWLAGNETICQKSTSIKCIEKNAHIPDVVNMSFSWEKQVNEQQMNALLLISAFMREKKVILVSSAGNKAQNSDYYLPVGAPGVISVGSTNKRGVASGFSNWGNTVEIMAPGQDIWVANRKNYKKAHGTSYAAPLVSGVISLMRSVYPDLNWKEAVYFLQSTAVPMGCDEYCSDEYSRPAQKQCRADCCVNGKQLCTPGRVNAGLAVSAALAAQKRGTPPAVALIDAWEYRVVSSEIRKNGVPMKEAKLKLYNVGGAAGDYHISSKNPEITVSDPDIRLAKKGYVGDTIEVSIWRPLASEGSVQIFIDSPQTGHEEGFTDEIIAYVD